MIYQIKAQSVVYGLGDYQLLFNFTFELIGQRHEVSTQVARNYVNVKVTWVLHNSHRQLFSISVWAVSLASGQDYLTLIMNLKSQFFLPT